MSCPIYRSYARSRQRRLNEKERNGAPPDPEAFANPPFVALTEESGGKLLEANTLDALLSQLVGFCQDVAVWRGAKLVAVRLNSGEGTRFQHNPGREAQAPRRPNTP